MRNEGTFLLACDNLRLHDVFVGESHISMQFQHDDEDCRLSFPL